MKKLLLLIVGLLAVGLTACSSSAETTTAPSAVIVTVNAEDIKFSTNRITAKAGQRVRLEFENDGVLLHDFTISDMPLASEMMIKEQPEHGESAEAEEHDEDMAGMGDEGDISIHMSAQQGDRFVVEFTPTEPGTYTYVCTVPGHKEAGMIGEFIVEEGQ